MTSLCLGRMPGASTPVSDRSRVKKRRARLPTVEPLEGRRLASVTTPELPRLAAEHELREDPAVLTEPLASSDAESDLDGTGLAQLARYLNRSWYRAGIPTQRHDDCSQEVYLTLLQDWGHDRFHRLVGDIDRLGIRGVFGRETAEGPDFFRAVDRVKKRAQRERPYCALDDAGDLASPRREELTVQRRADLHETIDRVLGPHEAALIDALLAGQTPAEIAARWGVAAKTVSNAKSRVLHKLRDGLRGQEL